MTLPTDTLTCDSTRLAHWQTNPDFDYNRELVTPEVNLWEWIMHTINRWMDKLFDAVAFGTHSKVIFIIVFVLIVALLVWFIYKKKPELFMRSKKKNAPDYVVHEDNIHGIDFDAEIARALARHDYRNATRLVYLQTVKHLSDNAIINWQLYKTPTEYIYEVQREAIRTPFSRLTNRFLRVRYGNFSANLALFEEMKVLQTNTRKGVEE